MLGTKRTAPRMLGSKNQKVDLLGAKVVYHDPKKTKMPSLWEETEEKLHLEKK